MRVVKSNEGVVTKTQYQQMVNVMAGEMLNKETSLYFWHDGERTVVGDGSNGTITRDNYNGYPKIVIGNIRQTIKASFGYIFVTGDVNKDMLCQDLREAVLKKEEAMVDIEPLGRYHTRVAGHHTNVKVRSQQTLTIAGNAKGRTTNIRRHISDEQGDHRYVRKDPRFTWYVRDLREFNPSIQRDSPQDAIANYMCSILYDAGDVTDLYHNDTLTNYSKACLKATSHILCDNNTLYINPKMPAIMRQIYGSSYYTLHTIPCDIYNATLAQIDPVPAKTDEDGVFSIEHCSSCRELLYDDVYAFVDASNDTIEKPPKPQCHMFCAICAHGRAVLYALADGLYTRVLKVKWPRTTADMIAQYRSPEFRPLLTELHTSHYEVIGNYESDRCFVLIGKNYAGVKDIGRYSYSQLVNDPALAGRQIVEVSIS